MKTSSYYSFALWIAIFIFSVNTLVQAQPARQQQTASKKTFFTIQKAFNDYWESYNVNSDGYYIENGLRQKAMGWKQFKRWEWYWDKRVDPGTGEFPDKHASDFIRERKKTNGSRNATGNWTPMGPSSTSGGKNGLGRLNCIAFRPGDNNTFYVGSPSGGLWKTTNGGTDWTVLTDQNAVLGVSDIIVVSGSSPSTDTIYIATGDRDGGSMWSLGGGQSNDNNSIGILKSTDGGGSWSTTGLSYSASQKKTINRLLVHPNDNNIIYAATSAGLYQSTDSAATWSLLDINEFIDMEFKPGNPSTMYGSTRFGRIFRSTNSGITWTKVFDNIPSGGRRIDLAVSANQSSWVYAVEVKATTNALLGVFKSTDSGATFNLLFDGSISGNNILGLDCNGSFSTGQGDYDLAIAADPNDANIVFVGGVNTWKSTNGGSSWSISNMWSGTCGGAAVEVHGDKHFFAYQNGTSTLFECNDGGLYKTSDGGATWPHLGNGLAISQMYRLGVAQSVSDEIITGLQDNGTKTLQSGIWDDVNGGDGMECMIDYTDENIQYGESQNGNLKRTTDHWASSTSITSGLSGTPYWVMPIVIDPIVHTTIYAATDNIYRSINQGSSWANISPWGGSSLRAIALCPNGSSYIYTSTQSILYKTVTDGFSWYDITGTLPTGSSSITYISVKHDDANTVWVSMGQYNTDGVFQSIDGGLNWTNISAGLPPIPVMCVIQNKQNAAEIELYAGTDIGVYVKVGSANWTLFSDGLPNVVVNELEIYYNTGNPGLSRIRAATSGRGLWESEIYAPPNAPPVADFIADITKPTVGQTISLTNLSTNIPTSWLWSFTPSTISFVGGSSATSQNPQLQFNASGYYTVQLTSTNAHGNGTEIKTDYIGVSYCTASGGGDEYISGVQLTTINNTGTGDNKYHDYTNLTADVTLNHSYNIVIFNGNIHGDEDLGIWIDWNQDGDFTDIDENTVCGIDNGADGYFLLVVPTNAQLGATVMRVRIKRSGSDCGNTCGITTYGEVEDYRINVLPLLNTWLGNNSDWQDIVNWTDGNVPNSSHKVTIPQLPMGGSFPHIIPGGVANCKELLIEPGALIFIDGTLTVGQ
ncbi:MAG: hypothetical protein DRI89_03165 [Bacteroidetes bacterium]|nr:MAG: hypothetical protein DRI89_03165 [Bacteroidota bacterium]